LTPLYLYVSTFRSMCAVPNMAVFCSSLTSWFPGMLLTYFPNAFEIIIIIIMSCLVYAKAYLDIKTKFSFIYTEERPDVVCNCKLCLDSFKMFD
jgi:hypothetical protein